MSYFQTYSAMLKDCDYEDHNHFSVIISNSGTFSSAASMLKLYVEQPVHCKTSSCTFCSSRSSAVPKTISWRFYEYSANKVEFWLQI